MAPFPVPARLIPAMVGVASAGALFFAAGCDEKLDTNIAKVNLGGKTFLLEIVSDDEKRYLGMGKRDTDLEADGGMLFIFPNSEVRVQEFVMRDCKFDIDIVFLDGAGRVLKTHNMKAEAPRTELEQADKPDQDDAYGKRLKKYSSKYPSTFVIEIKGGSLQSLNLKEGDLIKQKWDELKKLAH